MALNDTFLRALKPSVTPQKHSDGGGLHVLVTVQGSKLWRLAYRFGGKQKTLALGIYPAVTLQETRRQRDEAKKALAKGVDPGESKKLLRIAEAIAATNSFDQIADEFLAKVEREGRADSTLKKKRWLVDLVRPDLGARPISEITAAEILACLRKVEEKGNYETVRRMRATISQVYRYAVATSRAATDPTFGLRGALTTPKVTHRAALINRNAYAGLLRAVWKYEGMPETRIALQLMALLYPRPGELRQARWSEFDLDNAVWTIPAERMKMRREHRKPLSRQATTLLQELRLMTGSNELAFPAVTSRQRCMSENTLNSALRRTGFSKDEVTSHGFRASASSLLNESGRWSPDAIEAELAHIGTDEVRRAYHRALYWEERLKMADWWGQEIEVYLGSTASQAG